jgi:hypothetical protein
MRRFTIGLVAILILFVRSVEAEAPGLGWDSGYPNLFRIACRALIGAFARQVVESLVGKPVFARQADGGGDGGGGDGGDGSGGDGGSGDSGGDAGGGGGDGDGNGDAAAGDAGAVGDPGDPANSDNATDTSAASDPSDPSTVDAMDNAEPDVPTNDPALGLRGPSPSGSSPEEFAAIGSVAPKPPQTPNNPILGVGVDVGIKAVIVSGAPTPWAAVGKGPGVRNVIITGGIIALGEAAISKPSSVGSVGVAGGTPEWLRLRPDWRYLNGSVFPPVMPNVIDIRTISNTEEVIENPPN